ncbi:MAG: hypothetical protein K0S27_364 [Gammaproteobacteria bacterium]|nr:hypothetical protein [Gammaproteobacteria bacterium]
MSLIFYKTMAGILIFITSLVAVIYPIKVRAYPQHHPVLEIGDAFASGIFLGAALFHMLPDAVKGFAHSLGDIHYPIAEFFCAFGFLFLLFLERLTQCMPHFKDAKHMMSYMAVFILIIHSLIEGGVLGLNSTMSTAFVIFVAIIAHKSSESFALVVILNRSQLTLKKIIMIAGLFSVMTPLGILLGTTMTSLLQHKSAQLWTAGFDAFAAGTFLYMSTLHHINHHERMHEAENLREFLFLFLGLTIMGLLAGWV